MDVIDGLKNSSKGQLKYDKIWQDDIPQMLKDCTSRPCLSQGLKTPDTSFEEEKKDDGSEPDTKKDRDEKDVPDLSKNDTQRLVSNNVPRRGMRGSKSLTVLSTRENRVSPLASPSSAQVVDTAIRNYEQSWENKKNADIKARREAFEESWKGIQKGTEDKMTELTIKKELDLKRQVEQVTAAKHAREREVQLRQQKLREENEQKAKLLDAKVKEAEAQKRQQEQQRLEEERQRQQEIDKRLAVMGEAEQQILHLKEEVNKAIESCPVKDDTRLNESNRLATDYLNLILKNVNTLVTNAKSSGPTEEHLTRMGELLTKARNAKMEMMKSLGNVLKQAQAQQMLKKQQEDKLKAKQEADAKAKAEASSAATVSAVAPGEILCVPEDAFQTYNELKEKLQASQASYASLVQDANLKKYRFNLQKAVNTPVNAIAPTNGAHLRDKLKRLVLLLAGDVVEVTGKRISAKEHPAGMQFVRDLFAKKLVKQSDEQVSSNYESAFAIAAVCVGVWALIPEVGDLILAHFHALCPYIVPYYVPREEGQSSEEYYKALGYNFTDGQPEQQDKFLKRMSGLMRLYSSILTTDLPAKMAPNGNPHGLNYAWMWITRILNMEPRPDITATLLHDFLQVTGCYLSRTFGRQFHKLLFVLQTEYMQKIRAVTPSGAGGPLVRLENCLEKWIKEGRIPPPEGVLSSNFWYTG
ncbi:mRNA export factor GLE1-like [Lineus longissimus]|uniref:mRNA export factor GLE1-like n=1 Tax=Lineus longissimus TaxID=88925 RepID=UPI002B4CC13A